MLCPDPLAALTLEAEVEPEDDAELDGDVASLPDVLELEPAEDSVGTEPVELLDAAVVPLPT